MDFQLPDEPEQNRNNIEPEGVIIHTKAKKTGREKIVPISRKLPNMKASKHVACPPVLIIAISSLLVAS